MDVVLNFFWSGPILDFVFCIFGSRKKKMETWQKILDGLELNFVFCILQKLVSENMSRGFLGLSDIYKISIKIYPKYTLYCSFGGM